MFSTKFPSRALLCIAAGLLAVTSAAGQTVVWEEDFDPEFPDDWTSLILGYSGDEWLYRDDGNTTFPYSNDVWHEGWCDHGTYFRNNYLITAPIDLSDTSGLTLSWDNWVLDAAFLVNCRMEITTNGGSSYDLLHQLVNAPDGRFSTSVDISAYAGQTVQLALHYSGAAGNDWGVDNLKITTPWTQLGQALPGSGGEPVLRGTGSLTEGTPVTLELTNAPPNSWSHFILGFGTLNLPFYGGTMVPTLDIVVPLLSNGSGALTVGGTWPAAVPAGIDMYFQYWIESGTGPFGFVSSNAIQATTP